MQPKQMMFPFVLFVVALVFSPGCSGTPSIDQIGLEFRNLPNSASLMTGLKLYTTSPGTNDIFNFPLITKFFIPAGMELNYRIVLLKPASPVMGL